MDRISERISKRRSDRGARRRNASRGQGDLRSCDIEPSRLGPIGQARASDIFRAAKQEADSLRQYWQNGGKDLMARVEASNLPSGERIGDPARQCQLRNQQRLLRVGLLFRVLTRCLPNFFCRSVMISATH
jgi:hypothetical protein